MKALFDRVPQDIRIHLIPEGVEIAGNTATVEAVYYFRPRMGNVDWTRVPAYAKGEPQAVQLHLRKMGDEWLVEDVHAIAGQLTSMLSR